MGCGKSDVWVYGVGVLKKPEKSCFTVEANTKNVFIEPVVKLRSLFFRGGRQQFLLQLAHEKARITWCHSVSHGCAMDLQEMFSLNPGSISPGKSGRLAVDGLPF